MRILFVHNKYKQWGGEDTVLQMEHDLLVSKGHEVSVLEFDNRNINGLYAKVSTGLSSLYNVRSARRLEERINSFNPHIIHVHNLFFEASPSILYKARSRRIPLIMTIHNYRLVCANALLLRNNQVCELCVNKVLPLDGIRYKCYRSSAVESALVTGIASLHKILSTWKNKVNRFIVPSVFLKYKLQHSSLKLNDSHVTVLPNFVQDSGPGPTTRGDYFLFVGRLSEEKGIHILLDCFEVMHDLKLLIAGDGPEKEKVQQRISGHSNITYVGQQPKQQIIELMKNSRALVFPSRWYEGLPMTIVEALCTGTPVIASNIGAMAEMIKDGYNGFLFAAGNSVALIDRIRHFNSMTAGTGELYTQARQSFLDRYHADEHYRSLINIYETPIANSASANV